MLQHELRIGNVLLHGGVPVKVTDIFKTHFICETFECISHGNSIQERFAPIPLTAGVLRKCGFTEQSGPYFFSSYIEFDNYIFAVDPIKGYTGEWSVHNDKYEAGCNAIAIVKYLHQLQNIIHAISGQELNYTP